MYFTPCNKGGPVEIVSAWLRSGEPSTYVALAKRAGCSTKWIREKTKGHVLVSMNKQAGEKWIVPLAWAKQLPPAGRWVNRRDRAKVRPDRWGFIRWKGAVFHPKQNVKLVLLDLIKRIPHGLTQEEANNRFGRSVSRQMEEMEISGEAVVERHFGKKIYFHPSHIADQRMRRRTCVKIDADTEEQDDVQYIPMERILETLTGFDSELIHELGETGNDLPIFLALIVQYMRKGTYRYTECLLKADTRIREACGFEENSVPDFTTICRHFNALDYDLVKKLFMDLVRKLHDVDVIDGRFLAIDGTHIFAWARSRRKNGEVVNPPTMASWGFHHQYFYGYTVTILVDVKSELPIAIKIHSPTNSEIKMVIPLTDLVRAEYPDMDVHAMLGDALYDSPSQRKHVEEVLEAEYLTPVNPRRDKSLKRFNESLKRLFDRHGETMTSVEDVLQKLGQKFLDEWEVDCGGREGNRLISAIKERLFRRMRITVERVFSRVKAFTLFERPRVRKLGSVMKHTLLSFMTLLIVALTAHRMGIPQNTLSWSRIY